MRALILAAGRGERMLPLTATTPKPLLHAGGKALVEWHIEKLAALGIVDIVVNIAHLAEQFPATLGDGSRWGVRLHWSREGAVPLETGGGMLHALPLLGAAPFLLVNGDVWCDLDFSTLPREPVGVAHLVMVDPPPEKSRGDFALSANGLLHAGDERPLTYAGIGVYRPQLLAHWREVIGATAGAAQEPPQFPLAPLLRAAMARGAVSGEHFRGQWTDVGTPARLATLDARLRGAG